MSAISPFLEGILDYAGLFPPAALDLRTALGNYEFYRRHRHGAVLARFVLPLNLLGEKGLPDRITLVARGDAVALPALPSSVEAVEVAGSIEGQSDRPVFQEIDWRGEFEREMDRAHAVKLRTGGVTPDAVPPAPIVARFLKEAAARSLALKFTAGLHSPVPHGGQHGFFNVFAAAFAARSRGASEAALTELLSEASWEDFRFDQEGFRAGPFRFQTEEVRRLRRECATGFGSCSFLEPVEHLIQHGYLPAE